MSRADAAHFPCNRKHYDVAIVGAGPHGLSVLSAVHCPLSQLSESKHAESQWKSRSTGNKTHAETISVCVVDSAETWMAG